MKCLWLTLALALIAAETRADELNFHLEEMNLQRGDARLSGALDLQSDGFSNGNSSYSLEGTLGVQYFAIDHLSLGGSVQASVTGSKQQGTSQSSKYLAFGPLVTWFFWTHDRLAAYVEPQFFVELWSSPTAATTLTPAGALGVQWFILPSVGLGPGIRYQHRFGSGQLPDDNEFRFYIELSVYL